MIERCPETFGGEPLCQLTGALAAADVDDGTAIHFLQEFLHLLLHGANV